MIRHIVMWKFREGEEENREKFLSGLQALDGVIPEIRHMEIHRSCKPGNPYDACLIADFDDLEALSRYKNDPAMSPSPPSANPSANPAARSTTSCEPSLDKGDCGAKRSRRMRAGGAVAVLTKLQSYTKVLPLPSSALFCGHALVRANP